ncbi:hypothetical protein BH24CHL4_BH24CHL4_15070 [soil metagenome]
MNANHEGWLAGSAVMPFPIEAGTPMAGYAARTGHSNGTLDPLTVSALALSVQGRELVIVSADVVAVDAAVTQKVAAAAGIARSSLLIAASHTHSGPAGISNRLHPASAEQVDHDLRRRFVAASAETIALAREGRLPATVSIGQAATTGLASNRNDPAGPYDPGLTVLTVQRESGAFDAVLVQWACHPTTLGAGNARISADFPGTLRSHLRGQLAPGDPVVVYLNGAAGDISTRFTRAAQTPNVVDRLGAALADASRAAMANADPLPAHINHASTTVQLAGWSQDEISETLARLNETPVPGHSSPAAMTRSSVTRAQGLALLQSLAQSPCRPRRRSLRLDVWTLGDWVILGVPGELFASLGQHIMTSSPHPAIIAGYAGGYAGYLADQAAYAVGTYESLASPFAPGSGEKVSEAAITLLRDLSGSQ